MMLTMIVHVLGACAMLSFRVRAGTPLRAVMSNSFGFGGTNCSLVFKAYVHVHAVNKQN